MAHPICCVGDDISGLWLLLGYTDAYVRNSETNQLCGGFLLSAPFAFSSPSASNVFIVGAK